MTAREAYEKLYKGVKADLEKWTDDELQEVYKLGKADLDRINKALEAIQSEMDRRGPGKQLDD